MEASPRSHGTLVRFDGVGIVAPVQTDGKNGVTFTSSIVRFGLKATVSPVEIAKQSSGGPDVIFDRIC